MVGARRWAIEPGLKVGYVMGIGDEVPAGIAQLGASVTPGRTGTWPPAISAGSTQSSLTPGHTPSRRLEDLQPPPARLRARGRQRDRLVKTPRSSCPNTYAPFPAQLPARAEVSEDSPVDIPRPLAHPLLTTPNRNHEGQLRRLGGKSKFFTEWDAAYTPLNRHSRPGTSAAARRLGHCGFYGKGRSAISRMRVPPTAVPGTYHLLANLLSLGKIKRPHQSVGPLLTSPSNFF